MTAVMGNFLWNSVHNISRYFCVKFHQNFIKNFSYCRSCCDDFIEHFDILNKNYFLWREIKVQPELMNEFYFDFLKVKTRQINIISGFCIKLLYGHAKLKCIQMKAADQDVTNLNWLILIESNCYCENQFL